MALLSNDYSWILNANWYLQPFQHLAEVGKKERFEKCKSGPLGNEEKKINVKTTISS